MTGFVVQGHTCECALIHPICKKTDSEFIKMNKNSEMHTQNMMQTCNN